MRILIAEDDKISQRLLHDTLARFGECVTVDNGTDAFSKVTEAIEGEKRFDMIFLDIMMPGLDGQDALKKIREFEESKGILGLEQAKIVMVTALDDKKNIMGAFKGGCEGYIVKPIDRQVILEKVEELTQSK